MGSGQSGGGQARTRLWMENGLSVVVKSGFKRRLPRSDLSGR